MKLKEIKKHLCFLHPEESKAHKILDAFMGLLGPDFEPQDEHMFSSAILSFNDIPRRELSGKEMEYGLKLAEDIDAGRNVPIKVVHRRRGKKGKGPEGN